MDEQKKYIDAERLKWEAETCIETTDAFIALIDEQPAADVLSVVRAHWHDVYMTGASSWAGICSHCGKANDIPQPISAHFCPNCGADMRPCRDAGPPQSLPMPF